MGRTLDVLIDAPAPEGRHLWLGRTYADAPDVDGVTWVRGTELQPGDLVSCEIVAAEEYDLVARAGRAVEPNGGKLGPSRDEGRRRAGSLSSITREPTHPASAPGPAARPAQLIA